MIVFRGVFLYDCLRCEMISKCFFVSYMVQSFTQALRKTLPMSCVNEADLCLLSLFRDFAMIASALSRFGCCFLRLRALCDPHSPRKRCVSQGLAK